MTNLDFSLGYDEKINTINQINQIKGVCCFVDISNSTGEKLKRPDKWISIIWNTFSILSSSITLYNKALVKYIGDEVMLFWKDDLLQQKCENLLTLLDTIRCGLIEKFSFEVDGITLNCKSGVHYCENVYEMTFQSGRDDYYGSDIDLTARLIGISTANKVIVSEKYIQKLLAQGSSLPDWVSCVKKEQLKGFIHKTPFREIQ